MKIQITHLSPHQNAKVFGVLMAVSSLLFVIPMVLVFSFLPKPVDASGNTAGPPAYIFLLFPIMYLVMGYVMARFGCLICNRAFRYIGGIEFDQRADVT